ncbi:MAG: PQQ-binding-like beta-propeller repeat protein, partial [Gemmatimonadota bacterium]|nr:PQQ-binding-like beta-propeller repeat protein [Gemmatimonadota bacterium]
MDASPRAPALLVRPHLLVLALGALLGCSEQPSDESPAQAGPSGDAAVVGSGTIRPAVVEPEDGEWRMPAKDFASTRFSGLDEIRADNAKNLELAWTFSTGVLRGHEAAPIVANNTMYVVTPHPNYLYALDLTRGGALKWKYDPGASRAARGVACCDVVNRGAVYADGRVFFNTLDVHTVAVDAETGEEVWKVKLGEISRGETMTMAPLVAKGKVFVGNSGGEMGVRGWIAALDAATGEVVWRAYSTGPDADVLIGPDFRPFYEMDRGTDLGVT